MPLYNNNIQNYFKPFATTPSLQKKRPFSEGDQEERNAKRSPSISTSDIQRSGFQKEATLPVKEALGNTPDKNESLNSSLQSLPASSQDVKPNQTPPMPSPDETIEQDVIQPATIIPLQGETASRMPAVPSSQTVLTSSQRIVKNGEVMIRNSDDESDSSLEDLDELIARDPLQKSSSPPVSRHLGPSSRTQADRELENRTKWSTRKPASPYRSTLPVLPKIYKLSLDSFSKQRKKNKESEDIVARALSLIESYDQRKASSNENSPGLEHKEALETDLITRLIKRPEDDDNVSRLQTAIQRTEALQYSKSWSFFDHHSDTPLFEQAKFPAVEDGRLKPILHEPVSRQQAFVSGYVGEYAMKANLPEKLLLWIMDEICLEARDDLRYSYADVLKKATVQLPPLLTVERIDALFRRLDATATAIDIENPVVPRAVLSQEMEHISRPCLLSVLNLLGSLAGSLNRRSRRHVFYLLCRLALDHSIVKDFHAVDAIGNLFLKLVELYPEGDDDPELQTVLTTIYHSTNDASLRLQLLQTIPPLHQLFLFRQRLALSFFFQDIYHLSAEPEDLVDFRAIAEHLQATQYAINSATDYAELATSIDILSIAIGCGNPPSPKAPEEDKGLFDSDVDILATKIRTMFTQIIDTSASHMKRTEAKEILEGFHSRLLFAIRTKPPPKKAIYGDSVAKQVGDMDAYVMRRKEAGVAIPNG